MAQHSWPSLYYVWENFLRGNTLEISVSFYLFCYSIMRWAANGSCTRSTIMLASSMALLALARYLQKTRNEAQQHKPPKPNVTNTKIMKISKLSSSSFLQRKSNFCFSIGLSTSYPQLVTILSKGLSVNEVSSGRVVQMVLSSYNT